MYNQFFYEFLNLLPPYPILPPQLKNKFIKYMCSFLLVKSLDPQSTKERGMHP